MSVTGPGPGIPRPRLIAPTRRSLVAAGATALAGPALAAEARSTPFRVAHLTDLHISPDPASIRGVERALAGAQGRKPDLLLLGGDMIMDAAEADYDWSVKQWDVFRRVMRAGCSVPYEACLGNHDLWGGQTASRPSRLGSDAKTMALDHLGLNRSYRSFDRGGWHFVILDSLLIRDGGYMAALGEAQHAWLAQDLARLPKDRPVLVLSHVPIMASCSFFGGENERPGGWYVPATLMHTDTRRLKDLFRAHNVRLCLSGHIHLADTVKYLGITYACGGAVCGNWWKGRYQEFGNGYSIIDLYPDGRFDYDYQEFAA